MSHKKYMQRCLDLASNGIVSAMPNPSVGAVLVYKDKIIGEGFTSAYGGNHGEVNCINSVKEQNVPLISKSILYVSLEPCSHFGKTPPCANLIVKNKIPHVVIACVDSFSEVAGKGIEYLKNNGIKVEVGVLGQEARELNKRFFTYNEQKRPYVILKWAQTKDGFIAPKDSLHQTERWITNTYVKTLVHKWRSEEAAILVGKNTVVKDNPSLTTREFIGKNPIRIVIDKGLSLYAEKNNYNVFNKESKTLIFNSVKGFKEDTNQGICIGFEKNVVQHILLKLHELNIQSLIIEGGSITLQSFIDKNLFDEARVFTANKIFAEGVKAPVLKVNNFKKKNILGDELTIYKNYI